jgi:hypothetical protein
MSTGNAKRFDLRSAYDDAGGDPMTDPIKDLIGDHRARSRRCSATASPHEGLTSGRTS